MKGYRRYLRWTLACLAFCWMSATICGEAFDGFAAEPTAWGVTDSAGNYEVFCQSGSMNLNVVRLEIPSVTWADNGEETDGVIIRTVDDRSMELHFTLPDG